MGQSCVPTVLGAIMKLLLAPGAMVGRCWHQSALGRGLLAFRWEPGWQGGLVVKRCLGAGVVPRLLIKCCMMLGVAATIPK